MTGDEVRTLLAASEDEWTRQRAPLLADIFARDVLPVMDRLAAARAAEELDAAEQFVAEICEFDIASYLRDRAAALRTGDQR